MLIIKWKAVSFTSNLGLLKTYKFGSYLVLSVMLYTTVVNVIQESDQFVYCDQMKV